MSINYKSMKEKREDNKEETKKISSQPKHHAFDYDPHNVWWNAEDEGAALIGLQGSIAMLSVNLLSRINRYRVDCRLYGISDLFATMQRVFLVNYNNSVETPDRLTTNVVQSNCDTLVSKMSKIKPRAKFLTNIGTYKAQNHAKKLSYFSDGIFNENDLYTLSRTSIRDSLVFGDGFLHVYEDRKRVKIERVLPYEILVDEQECLAKDDPTHMYRLKLVDRQRLMTAYPQFADKILHSPQLFSTNVHSLSQLTDQIEVCEAWHRRSSPESTDGKHIIAVPGCVLVLEDWKKDKFPITRLSWTKPFTGFYSQSLASQLKGIQLEINRINAVMQRSYNLQGSFKILVQNGSSIPTESFNNAVGTIIRYSGQKPEYIVPPIVQPEMYSRLQELIDMSYKVSGVSQLSAASQKPAGITAAVALQELTDIESNRFMAFSQEVEQFFVNIAELCIAKAREIAEKNGGSYPVNRPNAKNLSKIDLKEIELEEEDYTIQVYPASSLPETMSGRIATVDDLAQRGLIDPVEIRELLSLPDLQANSQLSTAQDEYLKEVFERFLETAEYTPPEPYDNLQLARKLCLQYYALAKKLGEGEDKLELFRQYLADLTALETPEPIVPQLPAVELGAQPSPAEAAALSLPAATGANPAADLALAAGAQQAGIPLPPTAMA